MVPEGKVGAYVHGGMKFLQDGMHYAARQQIRSQNKMLITGGL